VVSQKHTKIASSNLSFSLKTSLENPETDDFQVARRWRREMQAQQLTIKIVSIHVNGPRG